MPSLLELEEEVFLMKDDGPGGKDDKSRRFLASYIGCCDLQSGYTPTHLNYAIGQLADVRLTLTETHFASYLLRWQFVTPLPWRLSVETSLFMIREEQRCSATTSDISRNLQVGI